MHFQGHSVKEIARDGTELTAAATTTVENTVWIAPGQTIDVALTMNALGEGRVALPDARPCRTSSDRTASRLNIALAIGGMAIPVDLHRQPELRRDPGGEECSVQGRRGGYTNAESHADSRHAAGHRDSAIRGLATGDDASRRERRHTAIRGLAAGDDASRREHWHTAIRGITGCHGHAAGADDAVTAGDRDQAASPRNAKRAASATRRAARRRPRLPSARRGRAPWAATRPMACDHCGPKRSAWKPLAAGEVQHHVQRLDRRPGRRADGDGGRRTAARRCGRASSRTTSPARPSDHQQQRHAQRRGSRAIRPTRRRARRRARHRPQPGAASRRVRAAAGLARGSRPWKSSPDQYSGAPGGSTRRRTCANRSAAMLRAS